MSFWCTYAMFRNFIPLGTDYIKFTWKRDSRHPFTTSSIIDTIWIKDYNWLKSIMLDLYTLKVSTVFVVTKQYIINVLFVFWFRFWRMFAFRIRFGSRRGSRGQRKSTATNWQTIIIVFKSESISFV